MRGAARGLRDSFKISAVIIAVAAVIIWAVSLKLMYLLVGIYTLASRKIRDDVIVEAIKDDTV